MRLSLVGFIVWVGLSVSTAAVWADAPAAVSQPASDLVGTHFPNLQIKDQHDVPVTLPGAAAVIVFANAKAVDEWADPVLAAYGRQQMDEHHVVYLSDIHRMPWLIGKMIALPKLRERKYSVALIRDELEAPVLAGTEKGCLKWIQVQSGKIALIAPVCTPEALKFRLDSLAAR